MPDTCLFCRFIQGELPTPVVFESDVSFAFLDHRPLFPGHCLVLPRRHIPTLVDVPEHLVGPFFSDVQLVARAVESALKAEGTFVAMNNRISQSVPHLHVHVVPRCRHDGLRGFFWPRTRYSGDEEMEAVRVLVSRAIAGLRE
jgi:histidine triad (HIT) family protein